MLPGRRRPPRGSDAVRPYSCASDWLWPDPVLRSTLGESWVVVVGRTVAEGAVVARARLGDFLSLTLLLTRSGHDHAARVTSAFEQLEPFLRSPKLQLVSRPEDG